MSYLACLLLNYENGPAALDALWYGKFRYVPAVGASIEVAGFFVRVVEVRHSSDPSVVAIRVVLDSRNCASRVFKTDGHKPSVDELAEVLGRRGIETEVFATARAQAPKSKASKKWVT